MNIKNFAFLPLIGLFVSAAIAIAISMVWIDAPVAALFGARFHIAALETWLSGVVLAAGEFLLLAALLIAARISGRAGDAARILILACGASILAYASNHLLKIVFGRPVPLTVRQINGQLVFHFFHGNHHSSFPSGHMALLAAFATVLWQSYPGMRLFLPAVLCVAGAAMVAGNWHYVSDIIAGAALGIAMGLAAGTFRRRA